MIWRRILLLFVVLVVAGGSATLTVIFVAGSGPQLERHLEREWPVGAARFDSPRMTDLDTVRFQSFRLRADPVLAGTDLLVLRDLDWARPRLVPEAGPGDIREAALHFRHGTLQLERQDGVGWNFSGIAARAPDWPGRLPGQIEGEELLIRLRRISPGRSMALDLTAGPVELRRETLDGEEGTGELLWLWARLEAGELGRGELRAQLEGSPVLLLELDEVPLKRFPFADLAGLVDFPWPDPVITLDGLADLDWSWDETRSVVGIDHYLATISGPWVPQPLRYLEGHVEVTPDRLEWQLANGVYSRSSCRGKLVMSGVPLGLKASFTIFDWLGDPGLVEGLPAAWRHLAEGVTLLGESSMEVELEGAVGTPFWSLLRSLEIKLVGAGVGRREKSSGLHGTVTVVRTREGLHLAATNERSQLGGWVIPAGEWEGALDASGFALERRDLLGPRMQLEVRALDDEHVRIDLHASGIDLSRLIEREVGSPHATLVLEAHWRRRRGVSWRGRLSWSGLGAGETAWPGHSPAGEVSGLVGFRHERGRTTVQILASDRKDLWVARGDVSAGSEWRLEGTVVPDMPGVLPADAVPRILDRPAVAGEIRFELSGPLLEWTVALER